MIARVLSGYASLSYDGSVILVVFEAVDSKVQL